MSIMGGRFGKYGDLKRRKALQRGRREKSKLERANLIALHNRSGVFPPALRSSLPYAAKSYKSAVVAIPPYHLWGPQSKGCAMPNTSANMPKTNSGSTESW